MQKPSDRPPRQLTRRDHLAIRAFEHRLRSLGLPKSEACRACSLIDSRIQYRLLPWRTRLSIWWRTSS